MSAVRRLTPAGAERLRIASPVRAPLADAVEAGVTLLRIWPRLRFPPTLTDAVRRPWLAIVGDDTEISHGPCAYDRDGLRRLVSLAEGVAVYSGAADAWCYGPFAATAAFVAKWGAWTCLPALPMLDPEGRASGKVRYVSLLWWSVHGLSPAANGRTP